MAPRNRSAVRSIAVRRGRRGIASWSAIVEELVVVRERDTDQIPVLPGRSEDAEGPACERIGMPLIRGHVDRHRDLLYPPPAATIRSDIHSFQRFDALRYGRMCGEKFLHPLPRRVRTEGI